MNTWKRLRQWSRLFYLLSLLLLVAFLTTAMWSKGSDTTQEVIIDIEPTEAGDLLITPAEVRAILEKQLAKHGKGSWSDMPVAEMEALVNEHPLVHRADVYVDALDRLKVKVEQPEPLVRVIDQRGANYYVSREGKKIPLSRHFTPRVPVVTGDIPMFEDSLLHRRGHILAEIFTMARLIGEDDFLQPLVEQIHVEKEVITLVPKLGKFRVIVGNCNGFKDKVERLRIFYNDILPSKGWDTYASVDLRYKGQIIGKRA